MVSLAGHWWTLAPHVQGSLGFPGRRAPAGVPGERPWSCTVEDPVTGPQVLTGALGMHPDPAAALVVLIHGLGGSADSVYMHRAARACAAAGVSWLRLSLRGADLGGGDFHHAGLWSDVSAVLEQEHARRARARLLLGFSLGGHVALRCAAERPDAVDACAAVCSPVDLDAGCRALDTLRPALYRRHVLSGLKSIYASIGPSDACPTPVAEVARVKTVRDYDRLTVVRRFGFRDVDDYYAQASAGPRLPSLRVPSLYVQSPDDPMVPAHTCDPHLATASASLTVQRVRPGGHVGFPARTRLSLPGCADAPPGLEAQVVAWLRHTVA